VVARYRERKLRRYFRADAAFDLDTSLRRPGLSDEGRIQRQLKQNTRRASWCSAPIYSQAAEIPRAQVYRRQTFVELVRTTILNIQV
jgi:hypothetical protein